MQMNPMNFIKNWVKREHTIGKFIRKKQNRQKAQLLYDTIDTSG